MVIKGKARSLDNGSHGWIKRSMGKILGVSITPSPT